MYVYTSTDLHSENVPYQHRVSQRIRFKQTLQTLHSATVVSLSSVLASYVVETGRRYSRYYDKYVWCA